MSEPRRCAWAESDPLLRAYHDEEWGVPQHDSRALWELLMLEGFQAGLSWITVLRKREALRAAFKQFDPEKVARFKEADIERLMQNPASSGSLEFRSYPSKNFSHRHPSVTRPSLDRKLSRTL